MAQMKLTHWTVDYGNGPAPVTIPHAWRQDVDVRWEGPAVYRTSLDVPRSGGFVLFDGVSYQARVRFNGAEVLVHEGIWDAFSVPLAGYEGQTVQIEVSVIKNGGNAFPVKDVASGFLPYVFNTFGGIWRGVSFCPASPDLSPPAPSCRVAVEGTKIAVDGKPFVLRGVLTWGWYPELGHPNPSDEVIRKEVRLAKEMGFNTIKFCLWVPSHRFLEILDEEGLFAWLELPLWDPSPDSQVQERMFAELERIVLQYRRHANIIVWTCGCELSSNTTAEFRKRLFDMVKDLTGAALVKDNSGSSEMYGGDLREYGDFYDFHPYCDLPFYPVVLDSLLNGPRESKPVLLGEFNDIDVHRDLVKLRKETPFWASEDPFLNDVGVRWQHDLPRVLKSSRWARRQKGRLSDAFYRMKSNAKADFIRSSVQEAVAVREDIAGYVVTGWRDTPISTSGVVDDRLQPRTASTKFLWNREERLFVIPSRKPPWVNGGNRPGWASTRCFFEGDIFLRVGGLARITQSALFKWEILKLSGIQAGETRSDSLELQKLSTLRPAAMAEISLTDITAGTYVLTIRHGRNAHLPGLFVVPKLDFWDFLEWSLYDPENHCLNLKMASGPNVVATRMAAPVFEALQNGNSVVLILLEGATWPCPMWRECMYEWPLAKDKVPFVSDWDILHDISGDRAIDLPALKELLPAMENIEVDMNRVDTRTYAEHPVILRAKVGPGTLVATTLRPFGGLGVQPFGVMNNPAGADLLVRLMEWATEA